MSNANAQRPAESAEEIPAEQSSEGGRPSSADRGDDRPPMAAAERSVARVWLWATAGVVVLAVMALWLRHPAPGPPPDAAPGLAMAGMVTTESLLRAQGADCWECAQRNGCFDPGQQGGTCEATRGTAVSCGAGVPESAICLKTLNDIFTSKCAETLQLTPCLCGKTDPGECLGGGAVPTGPLLGSYECDFKSKAVGTIQAEFTNQAFGAGQANAIVQCAFAYNCKCFGEK